MKNFFLFICKCSNGVTKTLDYLSSLAGLGIRLYLLKIFFWSGWLKLTAWPTTLLLFQNEYTIIWLQPNTAAYLGTAAELFLPVLLAFGIGARFPAILLFIFNIFTVVFYPVLLDPAHICAVKDNFLWGILIGVIVFYGPGKLSIDYLLQKKVCKEYQY